MSNYTAKEALEFAIRGEFPEGFDQWDMEDTTTGAAREGWTIAHETARHHNFPEGIDCLALATKDGTTVAHVLALYGELPNGFSGWAMADHTGWTVAHTAACECILPEDFNQWDLADKAGYTVAQAAALGKAMARMYENELLDMADASIRNATGYTVAHFAAQEEGFLPDDYDQWELADPKGWTVAHEAVSHGPLPENFDKWDLTADNGETVANIAASRGALPEDFDRWDLVSEEYRREGWISQRTASQKFGL